MSNEGISNFLPKEYNRDIKKWQVATKKELSAMVSRLDIRGKQKLLMKVKSAKGLKGVLDRINKEGILANDIVSNSSKTEGVVFRVGFSFPKQGLFMLKGVSSGHKLSSPRRKEDWANPVLDSRIGILADMVVKHQADASVNAMQISRLK
ncbi:hypothetical protein DF185_19980 [Marinifilum breve]|uniref:Uncharacterized protein n=1 Tax=Marinifilum breve TaxID=2184082 RepID=A0A2V3ZT92_9BACT|nr:hypothetical protein [Marinifilum breve]PXX96922.1 hypothetical protein DF185_19980 [Marinifilum breve]